MTKQQKIREEMIQGVNMILLHNLVTRPKSTSVYANPEDYTKYKEWLENEVDEQIIKPLHSQGVVIKVERELPKGEIGEIVAKWATLAIAIEPLIKEEQYVEDGKS